MSKYNELKILRKREARTDYACSSCRAIIKSGDSYYSEEISDKRINYPRKKKFCITCHKKICQHREKK